VTSHGLLDFASLRQEIASCLPSFMHARISHAVPECYAVRDAGEGGG
jgi:hypothetical protein